MRRRRRGRSVRLLHYAGDACRKSSRGLESRDRCRLSRCVTVGLGVTLRTANCSPPFFPVLRSWGLVSPVLPRSPVLGPGPPPFFPPFSPVLRSWVLVLPLSSPRSPPFSGPGLGVRGPEPGRTGGSRGQRRRTGEDRGELNCPRTVTEKAYLTHLCSVAVPPLCRRRSLRGVESDATFSAPWPSGLECECDCLAICHGLESGAGSGPGSLAFGSGPVGGSLSGFTCTSGEEEVVAKRLCPSAL